MPTQKATTLCTESIDKFRISLSVSSRSSKTVKAYTTDLKIFLQDAGEEVISREAFEYTAMTWLTEYRTTVAQKTTGRRLTSLRSFVKWAGWGDMLADYRPPPAPPAQPHPLPEGMDGVRRMIEVAKSKQQRAMVALCGMCGCRIGEALAVRPSHIDMRERTLKVFGKGEKIRFVPISPAAWSVLLPAVVEAFSNNDALVVGLQDRVARANITQMGRNAGLVRSVSSHDLRATFATAVHEKTKDARLVQELLGHGDLKTTQIYIEVNKLRMTEAVDGL